MYEFACGVCVYWIGLDCGGHFHRTTRLAVVVVLLTIK